jgi:hypothetical protein
MQSRHAARRSQRLTSAHLELLGCAVALVVGVGVELVVARFIHNKGVNLTGDEPSYIIQAQAFLHLSPNILSTVKADLAAHRLSSYPVGATVSMVALFTGPHGMISPFEPGLGLLLIPFVAKGRLFLGATIGMLVLNTAGLVYLHRRVSRLATLKRPCQVLLGLVLAAPAVLLAVTQIYPDLPSGVLLACAVVEIVFIERTGTSTRLNSAVVLISVAYLPWLQIKNLAPAVITLLAFAIVQFRARGSRKSTVAISVVCLLSWGLLFAYNLRYFGHLFGLPEQGPSLGRSGVEYTLGLLFDRHQGLFVQVPIAVVGLVGLWMARKTLPISVTATAVSVGSILVLNGTYTANPYGGLSLAGRFMWTAIPVLIAWTAVVLSSWEQARRSIWWPIAVVGGLWAYQGIPILDGSHSYYNAFSQTPPWDPASWPGWWPGINRLLPQFDIPGHPLGAPAVALVIAVAFAAILVIAAWQYAQVAKSSRGSVGAIGAISLFVVVALVIVKPLATFTTGSYDAADLGLPVVGLEHPGASSIVDLQGVVPGPYALSLTYRLDGQAPSGAMIVTCSSSPNGPRDTVIVRLHSGQRTTTASIRCHDSGVIATQFKVGARSGLSVNALQLRSASSARVVT